MIFISFPLFAKSEYSKKNILVLVQGNSSLNNPAMGDGRQLAQLLGHFNTETEVKGIDDYVSGETDLYDYIFYIGFYKKNEVSPLFIKDVINSKKEIIWINTGLANRNFSNDLKNKYGFNVTRLDTTSKFNLVKSGDHLFSKGEENLNVIEIVDTKSVKVLATALSTKSNKEIPYIVKSSNLIYIADSPFAYATSTDRYLLFADMLHEILNEEHEVIHNAIVRIEDVTPLDSPDRIRDITDYLSENGIPFLIGVVPFYVDPFSGLNISLSDKPDMVDALRYLEKNGGTIVMHGVTHQYKDVTAADFEFWDANLNMPIQR